MKYYAKQQEVEAIEFKNTTEGLAVLSAFCGDKFEGVLAERNRMGLAVAIIGGMTVAEGSFLFKRGSGITCLKAGVFKMLYGPAEQVQARTILTPATAMQVALEAARTVESPTPVLLSKLEQEQANHEAAVASGAIRYAVTRPCLRGHITERYTKGKVCVTCNIEASARNKQARKRKEARTEATNTRKALAACTGPFAPLAASLMH